MKVLFNGVEYSIRWRYCKIPVKYGKNAGKLILDMTGCEISTVNPNISSGPDRFNRISLDRAYQKFGDVSNKALARKITLGRALRCFDKNIRNAIWKVFLAECRGPWKTKAIMDTASV